MLRFRPTIEKQIQAAAVLVYLSGGRIDRLRLVKLLYIADRESLTEDGAPIIGGRVVAMKHGPLHSDVYDLIKGGHSHWGKWSEFFENDGNSVVLRSEPGRMELSPYEIDKLTDVSNRFRDLDTWELAEKTHDFGEWKTSHIPGTSTTIPLERILEATGSSPDDIARIIHEAEMQQAYRRVLH